MLTGLQEPKKGGFEISLATDSNRLAVKFLPLKLRQKKRKTTEKETRHQCRHDSLH